MDKKASVVGGVAVVSFFILSAVPALAFNLKDHGNISQVALTELTNCVPQARPLFTQSEKENVVTGVIDEDLNIFRKWTRYSHYYNPYKKLDMRRADSSVAVIETENSLKSDSGDDLDERYRLLGRAIHYLQDAAVPAHVVPVSHWLTDGFESYDAPPIEISRNCDWVSEGSPDSLMTLLKQAAVETLTRLNDEVPYTRDGVPHQGKWSELFWTEGEGNEFGSYGLLGNNFGETDFTILDDEPVRVKKEIYEKFKSTQLNQAVDSTRRALLWFLKLSSPASLR